MCWRRNIFVKHVTGIFQCKVRASRLECFTIVDDNVSEYICLNVVNNVNNVNNERWRFQRENKCNLMQTDIAYWIKRYKKI